MRIESVHFRNFRRFSDLTITGLPDTARLVVLAGPNGVGKSSFLDGLQTWYRFAAWSTPIAGDEYTAKAGAEDYTPWERRVKVELHGGKRSPEALKESPVYFRTAYRHESDIKAQQLSQPPNPTEKGGRARLAIDADQTVSENYQRLLWQTYSAVFDDVTPDDETKAAIRDRVTGELRKVLLKVLPDLTFDGVGALRKRQSFEFTKGSSRGFPYLNLSGGEKAIFDLLLDAVVKADYYQDSIWCIDEPELHVGTKAQGALLRQLMKLLPEQSQLFIASHSLGFMSEAVKMSREQPDEVVFLDFGDHDFDAPVTIEPVRPDRQFWKQLLSVALEDMATLVAPSTVVMCEGGVDGFDAECYRTIFGSEFPDTEFISVGNSADVQNDKIGLTPALQTIVEGTRVIRLRDRDLANDREVSKWRSEGTSVLTRRHIEAYLFDPEVLEVLFESYDREDAEEAARAIYEGGMAALASRAKDRDDVKAASGNMYLEIRKALSLQQSGTDARSFALERLAPLVRPGMTVYNQLKSDIFDV